ncbi:hypothetical protein Z043_116113 [Scleropages formosus]|uniref:Uncharacterized protein n=1 Tax=Scleropages formosus TaxID=113540 RepID=A0A0P7WP47_SCLFO|nr:hypothetical protein Z043_116113 [Scleropages formosus]
MSCYSTWILLEVRVTSTPAGLSLIAVDVPPGVDGHRQGESLPQSCRLCLKADASKSFFLLQGPTGVRHGGRGRKTTKKAFSTDLSVGEPVSGRVLEVTDLPEGISRVEADSLLAELGKAGATIKWLPEHQLPHLPRGSGDRNGSPNHTKLACDPASAYTILAVFPSRHAAQSALLRHSGPLATFRLRTSKRAVDTPTLERASSQ